MKLTEKSIKKRYDQLLKEYDDPSIALNELKRWRALNDTFWFGNNLLKMGEYVDPKYGKHRVDPKLHGWLCDELDNKVSTLILIPRDSMKTSWLNVHIAQQILRNPAKIRICMFSLNPTLAINSVKEIRNILLAPEVRKLFPREVPDPGPSWKGWEIANKNQMTMRRFPDETKPPKEPQLEGWGMGKPITGAHYDRIFLDDVVDQRNTTTAEQIMKTQNWVSCLIPIRDPHGTITVVGTRWHFDDVYARLREGIVDRVVERQATEPGGLDDPDSKPIYSFYTKDMLRKIRDDMYRLNNYSHRQFYSQYYNDPSPDTEAIFPPPQSTYKVLGGRKDLRWFMTVDAAKKSHEKADFTAICIGALDSNDTFWIERCTQHRAEWDEISREIIMLHKGFDIEKVGIESELYDQFRYIFHAELRKWRKRYGDVDIGQFVEIPAPRDASKQERINRTLGAWCRSGGVYIQEANSDLILQMDMFPKVKNDDLVDAAAMLIPLSMGEGYTGMPDIATHNASSGTYTYTVEQVMEKATQEDTTYRWDKEFKK